MRLEATFIIGCYPNSFGFGDYIIFVVADTREVYYSLTKVAICKSNELKYNSICDKTIKKGISFRCSDYFLSC